MNRIGKYAVWFIMLSKRLVTKWSFIVLLLIIPAVMPLVNISMQQQSGIVRITVFDQDNSVHTRKAISKLLSQDSLINFSVADSYQQAIDMVALQKADAAWIFRQGYYDSLKDYADGKNTKPPVEIIQRENSIPLSVCKEALFGAMYQDISYFTYRDFVCEKILSENDLLSEQQLIDYYSNQQKSNNFIELERLGAKDSRPEASNYLTAPLRGILSLIVMLCVITSAVYFLQDQEKGIFNWLSPPKRLAPAFGCCFSASVISGVAVLIAILFSNISTGFINEVTSMLLYIISVTAFTLVFCVIFKSSGKLSAFIPGISLITLALSPIFFNLKVLKPVRMLLPTYYYLHSIYDNSFYLQSILYSICMFAVVLILNVFLPRPIKSH